MNETDTIDPHPVLSFFHICSQVLEGDKGPFIQTFGIILFVIVFNFLFGAALTKLRARFLNGHQIWAYSFVSALRKPFTYLVWFVALICSVDILASTLLHIHLTNIHLLISIGIILSFGWFLLRWNNKIVQNIMEMSQTHKISLTPSKLDLISKLATICVIFITIFLLMDATGRNMQTLIAFGGIGGLALAFASQQMIANFFGGVMVYITQPFTIGEWVNIPEKQIEGHIEEIGWYLTRIRNFEKRPIYVPNSIFTQNIVITPSRMSHERFYQIIGIRYSDINAAKTIIENIKQMLMQHPAIDHHLSFDAFLKSFGQTALDIEVSAYIPFISTTRLSAVKQDILLQIANIISAAGAEIATPVNVLEQYNSLMKKNK